MICNGNTPVAIAGIMGGLDSEIVDDTTTLTLESATFNAVSVRKSTVRLAHRTDASMRYEKCLDPEMTVTAIARFVYLLKSMTATSRLFLRSQTSTHSGMTQLFLTLTKTLLTATQALKSATTELLQHLKASALRLSSTTITSA